MFNPNLLFVSLFLYLFLLLLYFVPTSMAANCFNYNQVGGKHGWVNALIVLLFAGAPAIIMLAIQYGTYYSTDHMAWMQTSFASGNPPMHVLAIYTGAGPSRDDSYVTGDIQNVRQSEFRRDH